MPTRFTAARAIAGLTIRQAARQLNWPVERLQAIEAGTAIPTDAEVLAVARLCEVCLAWVIGEVSTPQAILARHGLAWEKVGRMRTEDLERFLEALDAVDFDEQPLIQERQ